MKILLTGAGGFLGKNLLNHLKDQEVYKVYNKNKITGGYWCNLTSQECVKSLFKQVNPEVVVHCASNPSPKHPEDYEDFLNTHIGATINLLEHCPENIKFIYISSVLVFGNEYPTIEPTNLYGGCKHSCEKFCEVYSHLKGLKVNIIRPCAITGKGLTHGLLFDIQRKLKSDSKELELFGNEPGTCKPYVHVDDVCNWINACIKGNSIDVVNCFPRDSLTVKQVAEIAMQELNMYKPIKWLGEETIWKGDNRHIDTGRQQGLFIQNSSIDAIRRTFHDS